MTRSTASRRSLLGTVLLSAGLLAGMHPSHAAHAALAGSTSDPLVALSNGVQMQLTANLSGVDVTGVQQVSYDVHVPAGVRVKSVTYTQGPNWAGKEVATIYADGNANTYQTTTTATTAITGVTVQATTKLTNSKLATVSASVSGTNNQPLSVSLTFGA
jgi:hypothetical protein